MKQPSTEKRKEQRFAMRLDKAFPVMVTSELYGAMSGIARNISPGGMMVEMLDPLPLGSFVTIQFQIPDSSGDVEVRAEIKHHYCFNFSTADRPSRVTGIGLRFVEFVEDSRTRWSETFAGNRVLH